MKHQHEPEPGRAARSLIAAAAIGVERLKCAAHEAFCRLAALEGTLARLERLDGSRQPESGEAASPGAVGKEAKPEQADGTAAERAASSLEVRARQRTRQGLAPPRELYDIRNRNRVDWSTLPEWAMPPDPDIFEGCAHEG
ncbi:MAG TPA: hypothetical protein VKE94_22110 [Gemmataceae bacterium]|nr:hypothetical protein [Gemmataceae bacterium]